MKENEMNQPTGSTLLIENIHCCKWEKIIDTLHEGWERWQSECGRDYDFFYGNPKEFTFCPFCGKKIKI